MVRGSGPATADRATADTVPPGRPRAAWCGVAPPVGRCGAVRGGGWPLRPHRLPRFGHWPAHPPAVTMATMEVITPPHATQRPAVAPVIGGTIIGTLLIVAGVTLAYVTLATPLLSVIMPPGRIDAGQMVLGMVAWAIALVAPAALVFLGTTRLARILGAARGRVTPRSPLARALDGLPEDIVLASGLTLADGRPVSDVVVGPFGAAVIRELPPATVTRIREGHWELRTRRGWIPLENPLDRATRDAERVRRWLAHDDADFVVKTYAAVVARASTVSRTPACAVLTADQIAPWIAALPPQRSLTPGRREQLIERVRQAAR
jgi:hypothetical protein